MKGRSRIRAEMAQHYVCCRLRTTEPPAALLPVTNLADSGVDTETIMRIVGHSSVEMFLRYRTIKAETLDAAMTRLNTLITRHENTARQAIGIAAL